MKVFTATQIRSWDAYTMLHEPISEIALMERAARACYQWIRLELPLQEKDKEVKDRSVKIFCAKGNNGGDGLAIARMFLDDGIAADVYILETGAPASKAFEENLQALVSLNTDVTEINASNPFPSINKADIVIDALFGTGLNKPLTGLGAGLVKHINESSGSVVAIDMPSGMYADESSEGLSVIQADYTLSFQCYKLGFLLPENESNLGRIFILDIGLHEQFQANETAEHVLLDIDIVKKLFRPRNKFAHKGNFGHALLVAGSFGKMGAAVLAANACLRSGVGLLTVQVPELGYGILQASAPEAMVITEANSYYQQYNLAGIGPGMDTTEEAINNVTQILDHAADFKNHKIQDTCCLVLDADALNIISLHPALLQRLPANTILTPHPKEFERLFGHTPNDFERLKLALAKAKEHNCFIILKGHHTLIACPHGSAYFNSTGNAGMATGGSGDVLTGILTGLCAQGYTAEETCLLGVYLHGLAGDKAADDLSQEALIAGDIIRCLGEAFKQLYL